ncbi:hypothetical protein BXZ70DRAFT_1009212 [Cristinia sonorae]|uniref:Uncharacterized protein n=1 Tax=Cristinia sonorae TaxID=1940300 RepID=A0A8K0UMF4_9AGAR|nr:hypothetical protein BXZ70DRAFT_1009212 [Cristinia sonorae]
MVKYFQPRKPTRRELRKLERARSKPPLATSNTPALSPAASQVSLAVSNGSISSSSSTGSLKRSRKERTRELNSKPKTRLLPRARKRGGRYKPIVVPDVESPPRVHRPAHHVPSSDSSESETSATVNVFMHRVRSSVDKIRMDTYRLRDLQRKELADAISEASSVESSAPTTGDCKKSEDGHKCIEPHVAKTLPTPVETQTTAAILQPILPPNDSDALDTATTRPLHIAKGGKNGLDTIQAPTRPLRIVKTTKPRCTNPHPGQTTVPCNALASDEKENPIVIPHDMARLLKTLTVTKRVPLTKKGFRPPSPIPALERSRTQPTRKHRAKRVENTIPQPFATAAYDTYELESYRSGQLLPNSDSSFFREMAGLDSKGVAMTGKTTASSLRSSSSGSSTEAMTLGTRHRTTSKFKGATDGDPVMAPDAGPSTVYNMTLSTQLMSSSTSLYGTPRTVNVPDTSFSDGKGTFSTQLPFPEDQRFLVSMSDAAGFATGGSSNVMEVGAALQGDSCNTTDPGVDFFFRLDSALTQCRVYTINGYEGAVQPVKITGIIPGGAAFELLPPNGPASYDWLANVKFGTSIVWLMTDSQGHTGGSSDVKLVGASDDGSCLSANSPSSFPAGPSQTSSALPSATTTPPPPAPVPAGPNVGLIAGLSIAGVFAVTAFILVFIFWRRRQRNGRYGARVDLIGGRQSPGPNDDHVTPAPISPYPFSVSHRSSYAPSGHGGAHAQPPSASSHQLLSDVGSESGRFTNPYSGYAESAPRQSVSYYDEPSLYGSAVGAPVPLAPPRPHHQHTSSQSSSGRSKASLAGAQPYKPARFILHTDIEEATPADEHEEVIELPPQYSERRGVIPSVAEHGAGTATPSSPQSSHHPR